MEFTYSQVVFIRLTSFFLHSITGHDNLITTVPSQSSSIIRL